MNEELTGCWKSSKQLFIDCNILEKNSNPDLKIHCNSLRVGALFGGNMKFQKNMVATGLGLGIAKPKTNFDQNSYNEMQKNIFMSPTLF